MRGTTAAVWRVVAVNLGLTVAGLLILELIFGAWVFGENYGLLVIPKNFTRNYVVANLYGGPKTVYRRDEHGLRGSYPDPSAIDILVIGGSTTNEIFITEGKTWSDVLARAFADNGNPMVVVNAGVDGQTTIGHIKNFDLWFPKIPSLKARYVLAMIGVNDHGMAYADGYLSKQDRMTETRRKVKRYLLNNSALYAFYRNLRGILRARDAKLIHNQKNFNGADWRLVPEPPDVAAAERRYAAHLDDYERRLIELSRRIREFGAVPIYVTQHRPGYRIRDGRLYGRLRDDGTMDIGFYDELSAFNRKTMEVCRRVGAVCVDLASELFFVDGDHYDEVHTSPVGSEKIGRYLYAKLRDVIR